MSRALALVITARALISGHKCIRINQEERGEKRGALRNERDVYYDINSVLRATVDRIYEFNEFNELAKEYVANFQSARVTLKWPDTMCGLGQQMSADARGKFDRVDFLGRGVYSELMFRGFMDFGLGRVC